MGTERDGEAPIFGVLGRLRVAPYSTGEPIHVGGTKPRQLLATLLLRHDAVVSTELLIEVLWPDDPPVSAVANIRTYVSGLRAKLPPAADGPRIDVEASGYRLRVHEPELDLSSFVRLVAEARELRAAGREAAALTAYERARALWRGEPLEDLPHSPAWVAELASVTELWHTAEEERLALLASAGRYEAVVDESRALLAEHPFREQLWLLLIDALARSGRDAEALAAYAEIRARMLEELGTEPGQGLRRRHEHLLGDSGVFPVRQLPPAVADFTGRERDRDRLAAALCCRSSTEPVLGAPPVAIVVGAPGVGKTTLAVQVGHQLRDAFPDGQLFVDLAGTSAVGRAPADLLAELLIGIGVSGSAMPAREAERAAMFRSRISDRRILLVLDNASTVGQIRQLLPATNGCSVLITSRSQLSELPPSLRLELGVLSPAEAEQLLTRIAGVQQVAGQPERVREISTACGRLPLALRMAGARLASRRWSLEAFAERLADESRLLSELRVGESGVRASFGLSLGQLPDLAVRLFGRLGLLNPRPQPEWVMEALLADDAVAGRPAPHLIQDAIEVLVEASLLYPCEADVTGNTRYHMHDLLWTYAKETAQAEPAADRRRAVSRVLGGWLGLVEEAVTGLPVSLTPAAPGSSRRWDPGRRLRESVAAASGHWFDAERAGLLAAIDLAAEHGLDELSWELAVAIEPYLDLGSHHDAWIRTYRHALAAVQAAGNRRGEAALLRALGQVLIYQDAYPEAIAAMRRSYERFRSIGDEPGAARAYAGVASAYRVAGRDKVALRAARRVIDLLGRTGQRHVEAQVRASLGLSLVKLGQLAEGERELSEALRLAEGLGDRHREASVLRRYAGLAIHRGEALEALSMLGRALKILEDIDDRRCGAYALQHAGRAHLALGDLSRAEAALKRAVASYLLMGDRRGEANCAAMLGEVAARADDPAAARRHLTRSAALWRELGADDEADKVGEAMAGLGAGHH